MVHTQTAPRGSLAQKTGRGRSAGDREKTAHRTKLCMTAACLCLSNSAAAAAGAAGRQATREDPKQTHTAAAAAAVAQLTCGDKHTRVSGCAKPSCLVACAPGAHQDKNTRGHSKKNDTHPVTLSNIHSTGRNRNLQAHVKGRITALHSHHKHLDNIRVQPGIVLQPPKDDRRVCCSRIFVDNKQHSKALKYTPQRLACYQNPTQPAPAAAAAHGCCCCCLDSCPSSHLVPSLLLLPQLGQQPPDGQGWMLLLL